MQFDKDRRENTQMINDKEQDSNLCDSERNFNRQTVYIRSGTGREETDVGKEMRIDIAEFHVLFLFFFFLVRMLAPYGALLREKRTSKLGRI
jgi:hypothetical protein